MKVKLKETITLGFLQIPKGTEVYVLELNPNILCSNGFLAKIEWKGIFSYIDSSNLEEIKHDD